MDGPHEGPFETDGGALGKKTKAPSVIDWGEDVAYGVSPFLISKYDQTAFVFCRGAYFILRGPSL